MTTAELNAIPCACVHSDAVTCARWRDGLDLDDPHYQRRQCECMCHTEHRQDQEDEDDL